MGDLSTYGFFLWSNFLALLRNIFYFFYFRFLLQAEEFEIHISFLLVSESNWQRNDDRKKTIVFQSLLLKDIRREVFVGFDRKNRKKKGSKLSEILTFIVTRCRHHEQEKATEQKWLKRNLQIEYRQQKYNNYCLCKFQFVNNWVLMSKYTLIMRSDLLINIKIKLLSYSSRSI